MRKMFSKNQIKSLSQESVEEVSSGTISDVLGLNSSGKLVKGEISGLSFEQLGQPVRMYAHVETESGYEEYIATFSFDVNNEFLGKLQNAKAIIFTFNNTFIFTPLSTELTALIVCNAIYDEHGNSMVARGRFFYVEDTNPRQFILSFDDNFAHKMYDLSQGQALPYGMLFIVK